MLGELRATEIINPRFLAWGGGKPRRYHCHEIRNESPRAAQRLRLHRRALTAQALTWTRPCIQTSLRQSERAL